jgi:NAD(P)-dependent dehydrogenase (short-subunit alcohol dehydrogenase family)
MSPGTGRVALVTGASAGIGEAAARALLGAGFTVYGTSRRAAAGETRGGAVFLPLDVTDDGSVAGAVREVLERSGRIDVLVNNAGIGSSGASEESSVAQDRMVFDVNVFGLTRMTKAVLPTCARRRADASSTCRRSADSRPAFHGQLCRVQARGRGLLRVRGPRGSRARCPDSARRALQHEHRLRRERGAG